MYQALYRKYRSLTFDEVVGQKSVTQTLKAQVSSDRLSHAYLFTGVRGTGKTSCAKILSRAVNCEHPVDGNPCNCCRSCKSILEGSCMDVLEIDAASNNGVDNVRSLRDDAIYTPSEVKKRVYIIDEVHMLSVSAFNALLKIIEEPPAHLIFILATTEEDKVPPTILSRCQRFHFRRLSEEDIEGRIKYVAYQEGIELDKDAAKLLSRLADGALRDGLSLLDQVASSCAGPVTEEEVFECLGLAGLRSTAKMMTLIAERNTSDALKLFTELYEQGKDVRALLGELSNAARDLLMLKTATRGNVPMLSGLCSTKEADALEQKLSSGELLRMVTMLQELLSGRSKSLNLRVDAELCLIRLCNPGADGDVSALNARMSRIEEQLAAGFVPAEQPKEQPEQPEQTETAAVKEKPAEERPSVPEAVPDALPAGFRTELISRLSEEFKQPDKSIFSKDCKLELTLQGDKLVIRAGNYEMQRLNRPEILQVIGRKASMLLNSRVTAVIQRTGTVGSGPDPLDSVIRNAAVLGNKMNVRG